MIAVFSQHDATVVAALIALIGTLSALYVQTRKVQRENQHEHATTYAAVLEIAADVKEVRADQREHGSELRSHSERLRRLEIVVEPKPTPTPKSQPRKKAM
jgi:hypothetical protein